jgi:hypothetical protein
MRERIKHMRNYLNELYEADDFGVDDDDDEAVLRSGGRVRVPLVVMDDARRFDDGVVRDAAGVVAGHRPGFLLSASTNADRRRAEEAWQRRGRELRDAWRGPDNRADNRGDRGREMTLDEAREAAVEAWHRRGEWLRNAWRGTR